MGNYERVNYAQNAISARQTEIHNLADVLAKEATRIGRLAAFRHHVLAIAPVAVADLVWMPSKTLIAASTWHFAPSETRWN